MKKDDKKNFYTILVLSLKMCLLCRSHDRWKSEWSRLCTRDSILASSQLCKRSALLVLVKVVLVEDSGESSHIGNNFFIMLYIHTKVCLCLL